MLPETPVLLSIISWLWLYMPEPYRNSQAFSRQIDAGKWKIKANMGLHRYSVTRFGEVESGCLSSTGFFSSFAAGRTRENNGGAWPMGIHKSRP